MEFPILQTGADFILQPTNSVTVRPREWAEIIGKKFPHARVHRHRRPLGETDLAIVEDRAVPGTIVICDSKIGPGVITLFDRLLPGEPGTEEYHTYSRAVKYYETYNERLNWFIHGLEQIGTYFQQQNRARRVSIAIPPLIDQGYLYALQTFQDRYQQFVEVWLY